MSEPTEEMRREAEMITQGDAAGIAEVLKEWTEKPEEWEAYLRFMYPLRFKGEPTDEIRAQRQSRRLYALAAAPSFGLSPEGLIDFWERYPDQWEKFDDWLHQKASITSG